MLSVSDLSTYEYCSRKLFLTKRLGLKEIPKAVAIRGKLIHEFYQRINEAEHDIVLRADSKELSDLKRVYEDTYEKILSTIIAEKDLLFAKGDVDKEELIADIRKNMEHEILIRAENLAENIRQHNMFGEELWRLLTPKIRSEERVRSEELGLIGVVDIIKEYRQELVPVEMKTGKAPSEGIWPNHKIQLAAYMLMLSGKGKEVKRGILRYLDADSEQVLVMNAFVKEDVRKKIDVINHVLAGPIPEYTENKNKCKACNLKDVCYDEEKIDILTGLLK